MTSFPNVFLLVLLFLLPHEAIFNCIQPKKKKKKTVSAVGFIGKKWADVFFYTVKGWKHNDKS